MSEPRKRDELTAREIEVLQYIVDGHTTREAAADLYMAHATVYNHLRNISWKLGTHTMTHSVVRGMREGWLR